MRTSYYANLTTQPSTNIQGCIVDGKILSGSKYILENQK